MINFRKSFLIIVLFTVFQYTFAQNLFFDDFDYPVRDSLEGLGGWFQSGANSPYNVKIVSPGLTYTGYAGSGIGNCVFFSNNPGGDIVLHNFTTQTTGNLYMAFLVRVDSMSQIATQGYNTGFDQSGGTTNLNTRFYLQKVSVSTFKMGVNKNSTPSFTSANYNTNTTYLIVLKYSFIAGSDNDSAKLYVFTSGVPSTEPAAPEAFSTTGTDLADQGQVFLSNMYAQSATSLSNSPVRIDGIRIGTTWIGTIFTGIKLISSEVPASYSLEQNYPNPFNPSTKIVYNVTSPTQVKIKLYDILAREIRTVVNEYHQPGKYEVELSANELPSGTYFYMMKAQDFVNVKKMILVK